MLRLLPRFLVIPLLLLAGGSLVAEKVADLPQPTTCVNDFAQVLSPDARRNLNELCTGLHEQAQAEIAVVTVKTLDGLSIEEFTAALEEKWKIGKKGEDRGALVVLSLDPRRLRVETGYGLEGILPDARVGAIIDNAAPFARSGDYGQALLTTVQGLADVIAADKGVTLPSGTSADVHYYHREPAPQGIGVGQIILGIGFVVVILILIKTGHIGWAFYLILNLMGGGDGGGGGRRGGGDWGGSGGGSSGGGGASTDF